MLSGVLTALLMSNFRKSHIDMVCVVDAPVAEAEQVKDESLQSFPTHALSLTNGEGRSHSSHDDKHVRGEVIVVMCQHQIPSP